MVGGEAAHCVAKGMSTLRAISKKEYHVRPLLPAHTACRHGGGHEDDDDDNDANIHLACHAIEVISASVGERNVPVFGHTGSALLLWFHACERHR